MALAWPSLLTAVMQQVLVQSGPIILGHLAMHQQAGLFTIAIRLAVFVTLPMSAVTNIAAPMIVEFWRKGNLFELNKIAVWSARLSVAGAILPLMVVTFGGAQILHFVGVGYAEAAMPLAIIALAGGVNAFTGVAGSVLLLTGKQKFVGLVMSGSVILNLVLIYELAHQWGATGIALSLATSIICYNVILAGGCWYFLRVDPTAAGFGLWKRNTTVPTKC